MKTSTIFALIVLAAFGSASALPQNRSEPQKYTYRISGYITDGVGRPAFSVLVCWYPHEKPLNETIPCTGTDEEGRYELVVHAIPGKYFLVAHPGSAGPDYNNGQVKSSDIIEFGAFDELRMVDLHFDEAKGPRR
jgi:hypothetical protein